MYRWVEHTGELELELEAPSERAVFEAAFEAMRELLECERRGPAPRRAVTLEARDRAALLADWLAELAFIAETEGLVPERLVSLELDGTALRALLDGYRGEPPHLVKGVTYHRLRFERAGELWRAGVVLDV